MKQTILTILFFLTVALAKAQTIEFNQDLMVNKLVLNYKTPLNDSIIEFMSQYHKALFSMDSKAFDFYSKETRDHYIMPDYLVRGELSRYDMSKIKPNIIDMYKLDSNCRTIQVGYSYYDTASKSIGVFFVYTFAIKKVGDSLKLFPLIDTYKFRKYKTENITYYAIDTIVNYTEAVDSLSAYNLKLARFFGIPPIKFTCYQFTNFAELNLAVGYDVSNMYMRMKSNAFADMYNKIFYSMNAKTYLHEIVHLYVGNEYAKTCNDWINEGLATYFAGSVQRTLKEHLKNLNIDLIKHTEYDLNDFMKYTYDHVDNFEKEKTTNYKYTLGGLICKLAYEKKGFEGIKTLMSAGLTKEDVYRAVEKVLDLKRTDFNTFFRMEIAK